MTASRSHENTLAQIHENYLEARKSRARAKQGLDHINNIVKRSQLAVESSLELMRNIEDARTAPKFSASNGCGEDLAFLLGARANDRLSKLDRLMIFLICENLDEIAAWFGPYEARLQFDAALAVGTPRLEPALLN
jgi:hypothetical protein